jgi:hypothetical protein
LIFLIKFDPAACDAASAAVASALLLALAPLPRGKAAGVKGFAWIIKVRARIVPNDEFVCQNCRGRRRFGARKVAAVEIKFVLTPMSSLHFLGHTKPATFTTLGHKS